MGQIVRSYGLGKLDDLITPTAAQAAYRLGDVVEVYDDTKSVCRKYMYVKSHTTLTAYQPYIIVNGSTAGAEVATAAPLTLAAPGYQVCVPQVAFTSGYYGFVLIQGDGKGLMGAETYAVGDQLEVITTATAFAVDGSTGVATRTVQTCAVCKEAGTTAVARNIFLLGLRSVVAGS
jgi:hypothetical protein